MEKFATIATDDSYVATNLLTYHTTREASPGINHSLAERVSANGARHSSQIPSHSPSLFSELIFLALFLFTFGPDRFRHLHIWQKPSLGRNLSFFCHFGYKLNFPCYKMTLKCSRQRNVRAFINDVCTEGGRWIINKKSDPNAGKGEGVQDEDITSVSRRTPLMCR